MGRKRMFKKEDKPHVCEKDKPKCGNCRRPETRTRPGLEYYLYCPRSVKFGRLGGKEREVNSFDPACNAHIAEKMVVIDGNTPMRTGWPMSDKISKTDKHNIRY
jgi:hypothetical protein